MFDQFPTAFLRDPQESYDLVIGQWFKGFLKSKESEELEEEELEYAEKILYDLTGFMLYYQDCTPSEWNADRIRQCYLTDFPRSLFRDDEYIYFAPEVLTWFFQYLENTQLLPGALDIVCLVDENRYEFYEEMDDVDNYSMRKGVLITADEEGIDTSDEYAVLECFKDIGNRELDGFDPDVIQSLYFILSSWVLPFSDSRYTTQIGSVPSEEMTENITILAGFLIQKNLDPCAWQASDVVQILTEDLNEYPMGPVRRKFFIPVLHTFFSFLAGEGLHPNAREIADAILPLQDMFVSDSSSDMLGLSAEIIHKRLVRSGVDIVDESAIDAYVIAHRDEIIQDLLLSENPELIAALTKSGLNEENTKTHADKKPSQIASIPKDRRKRYEEIITLTNRFCHERLDDEYTLICQKIAARLIRKRDCQMLRGKSSIWAAGIVYAAGQINFLFDASFEPYQSADDICLFFETKKSTTSQKATTIRTIIDMKHWDPEFSTSKMMDSNPFDKIRMTKDGFFI
jgi:hypothetical protein